jgi:S1-C subfamily serine protease
VSVQKLVVDPPSKPGQNQLAIADAVLPAVARIEATGRDGVTNSTGVMFRSDGQLITTVEAIDGATSITVYLNDGTKVGPHDVSIVGKSVDADVAVLKLANRTNLPVASGTTTPATWGAETVMVDASMPTRGPDITVGVVTKEVASVLRNDTQTPIYGLIQTTTRASVTPRSAGTVFVDGHGSVMGLVTSRAQPAAPTRAPRPTTTTAARPLATTYDVHADDDAALHYAIPAGFVWDVAGQIADHPDRGVLHPWLGIPDGQEISREEANQDGVDGGMKITVIEDGSSARQAGLRKGDVIIAIDKDQVTSYNEFVAALRRHKAGDQVDITYVRAGTIEHHFANIGAKPELP